MPAKSEKQRRFFGAEYSRKKKGLATKTKMSLNQMREFLKKG